MPEVLSKVSDLRKKFTGIIAIDGGINEETAPLAVNAGVNLLVAGTAVFGKKDRSAAIAALRS